MTKAKSIIFCYLVLFPFGSVARGQALVRGYVKAFGSSGGGSQNVGESSSALLAGRALFERSIDSSLSLRIHYDLKSYWSDDSSVFFDGKVSRHRIDDLNSAISKSENFEVLHNLDRFLLEYDELMWKVGVGRQAVSFGSGRVFNPTDIYAPFSMVAIDKEYRHGVDAVRVSKSFYNMMELDGGVVLSKEESGIGSGFLRIKAPVVDYDFSIILSRVFDTEMVGLDFQGDFWGQGLWFEGAYFKTPEQDSLEDFRAILGIDYRPNNDWYFFAECIFNGAGERNIIDYGKNALKKGNVDTGLALMAQGYLSISSRYQADPLVLISATLISNTLDQSRLAQFLMEYSLADDLSFDAVIYKGFGQEFSEFVSYGTLGYVSLRRYF